MPKNQNRVKSAIFAYIAKTAETKCTGKMRIDHVTTGSSAIGEWDPSCLNSGQWVRPDMQEAGNKGLKVLRAKNNDWATPCRSRQWPIEHGDTETKQILHTLPFIPDHSLVIFISNNSAVKQCSPAKTSRESMNNSWRFI